MKRKTKPLGPFKVADSLPLDKNGLDNFDRSAQEINIDRAFPDLFDGLLPVKRRILFSLYQLHKWSNTTPTKCARIVGDTLGKYHPHGDASCYDTMINMSGNATLKHEPHPTVEMLGNIGTGRTDLNASPAAMRYTECRLTPFSETALLDKEYMEVVPYKPNYDGTEVEPQFLPAKLPGLLINGTWGMGFAVQVCFPAFKYEQVRKLLVWFLEHQDATDEQLAAQFAKLTAVTPYGYSAPMSAEAALQTTFKLLYEPSYNIDPVTGVFTLTSIPPTSNIAKRVATILTFPNTADARDETDVNSKGTKVVFKPQPRLHPDELAAWHRDVLKALTCSVTNTLWALHNGVEVRYSLVQCLRHWTEFRIELERRVLAGRENHLVEALNKLDLRLMAVQNLDLIVSALRAKDSVNVLKEKLDLNDEEAAYIMRLSLTSLSKTETDKILEDMHNGEHKLAEIQKQQTEITQHIARTTRAGS